jgi:hypothetical protein
VRPAILIAAENCGAFGIAGLNPLAGKTLAYKAALLYETQVYDLGDGPDARFAGGDLPQIYK